MKLYCNDCIQAMSNMMGGIVDIVEHKNEVFNLSL